MFNLKTESHDKKDISSIDTSCKGKITLLITTHTRCLTTCDSFYKDKYISVIRKKHFEEPNMQNLLFHIDVRILCNRLNEHNLSNQSNLTLNQMQLRVRLRVHEGVGLCSEKKSAVKHSIHVK